MDAKEVHLNFRDASSWAVFFLGLVGQLGGERAVHCRGPEEAGEAAAISEEEGKQQVGYALPMACKELGQDVPSD